MTAKSLFEQFFRLCPLSDKVNGTKYKPIDAHSIEITFPGRGRYLFEYHSDKNWKFERLDKA